MGETSEGAPPLAPKPRDLVPDAFSRLVEQAGTYLGPKDVAQLKQAFSFAAKAHKGQVRKTGEAFVNHPIQVALILAELRMDADTITAALLHDTVEDTAMTLDDVEKVFSADVRGLIDGVTKITRIEIESLSEQQVRNIRKMLLAMSKDIRVIVIKLADRLHNMRTLQALREDRRIFKARETMEVFAPLAHRLGINSIKWELEDLAFYYLEPARFQQVSRMVKESRSAREEYLGHTIALLGAELVRIGLEAKITGRPKHLYSIYQKMAQKGKDFSEIYDLIALRVIVDTPSECYSCLGAVHTIWPPMPGRFKDYIAMPKLNRYQSLHTTVIGPAGRPLEIQIRTREMHRTSEYGVAAHWRYKDDKASPTDAELDEQLAWLRQMLDWTDEDVEPREFMESLRLGLTYSEVFVFTPKGEVVRLRNGSTPIDFAYAIHTEVGNHCVGAKVDGIIVPLTYELQMGDRVEVLTLKSSGPSRDWLNIVKTPSARSKIRAYFSRMSKDDDILRGRELLGKEMRKHGAGISQHRSVKALRTVSEGMGHKDPDDLMALIGTGKQSARQVANRLLKEMAVEWQDSTEATGPERLLALGNLAGADASVLDPARSKLGRGTTRGPKPSKGSSGVVVKGIDDVLVRLSRCCNPVPGDEIIGFVTRGRGVTVHRTSCPNAKALMDTPERIIEVEWAAEGQSHEVYQVEVFIEAIDRLRLYQDVTVALGSSGVNILNANMATHKDGIVEMRYIFEVSEIAHIEKILREVCAIEGVIDARRAMSGEAGQKRKVGS
ncbi:MAG: bifunctional (p)ppGpp synthetase/guanosine-3',5'-bis(diphosphate) 3'-pyrophosphohydrolase [Coriobacteriales bacterium]|jgi:GTP pyrophosphokinase|nr:bifunctional (p)ppGpp synthetase/guanosine-3',5'-bis(diphosphate) 3'-pyrophosphohydrolase [Coriobacteriales bacterium]